MSRRGRLAARQGFLGGTPPCGAGGPCNRSETAGPGSLQLGRACSNRNKASQTVEGPRGSHPCCNCQRGSRRCWQRCPRRSRLVKGTWCEFRRQTSEVDMADMSTCWRLERKRARHTLNMECSLVRLAGLCRLCRHRRPCNRQQGRRRGQVDSCKRCFRRLQSTEGGSRGTLPHRPCWCRCCLHSRCTVRTERQGIVRVRAGLTERTLIYLLKPNNACHLLPRADAEALKPPSHHIPQRHLFVAGLPWHAQHAQVRTALRGVAVATYNAEHAVVHDLPSKASRRHLNVNRVRPGEAWNGVQKHPAKEVLRVFAGVELAVLASGARGRRINLLLREHRVCTEAESEIHFRRLRSKRHGDDTIIAEQPAATNCRARGLSGQLEIYDQPGRCCASVDHREQVALEIDVH